MKFKELKRFWLGWLGQSNEISQAVYNEVASKFQSFSITGGRIWCDNQILKINEDLEAFVEDGRTGWDNHIQFRPLTKKSRAAKFVAVVLVLQNMNRRNVPKFYP